MAENKKFILAKEPFIRKADNQESTSQKMLDFMIALVPLILFAWIKNGLLPYLNNDTNFLGLIYPLLLVLVGGLTSTLLEMGWYKFIIKDEKLFDRMKKSFAPIPGLLLGMIVPLSTPIWVIIFGAFFATVLGKLIYGGFGHNLFNPALVGYLFILIAYPALTVTATVANSFGAFSFLNPSEIVAGATPLTALRTTGDLGAIIEQYGLFNMFLGLRPGSLAETSGLLCVLALVYLLVRKVTTWRIPVVYILTVFVLTFIIGLTNGYGIEYPLFFLFNGGLLFGGVFMASEPVTSPRNPNGKIIYALLMGALTVVFRYASSSVEGVAYSILIMNMFTPIIESLSAKLRVEPNKTKVAIKYAVIVLMFLGISAFPVIKALPKPVEYAYESKSQNYETLNFEYVFNVKDQKVKVTTDQAYKITNVDVTEFSEGEYLDFYTETIKANKFTQYVNSATEDGTNVIAKITVKGYSGNIVVDVVLDNTNKITSYTVVSNTESYKEEYNEEWNPANGDPIVDIPPRIITSQDNIDSVTPITGATYTSNYLKDAAKLALTYILEVNK